MFGAYDISFLPTSFVQAEADCTQAINLDKKVTSFLQKNMLDVVGSM